MTSDNFKRVGVAFSSARGATQRRDEYAILEVSEAYGRKLDPPARYAQYVGHREQSPSGEVMVGLPLGGRGWRHQRLVPFVSGHYAEVRFFEEVSHD